MALFKQKIKVAANDYTEQMLPQTRKQVFWDVVKLHWKPFLLYGLLFLLFTLPIHALAIIEDLIVLPIYEGMRVSPEAETEGLYLIRYYSTLFAAFKIPAFLILGIAIAGFSRVIRQYAWEEVVFFKTDFVKGIKTNGAQISLLSLLVGLLNTAVVYCSNTATMVDNFVMTMVWNIPLMLCILLAIPTFAYSVVAMSIYKNGFFKQLWLSFLLYVKRSWKTILAIVCCAIPFVLQMIPIFLLHLIGRIISPFLCPFVFLGWYLFALNGFDDFVNKTHYPQLVGRGTFVDEVDN